MTTNTFDAIDRNHDGLISRGEFETFMRGGQVSVPTSPPQDQPLGYVVTGMSRMISHSPTPSAVRAVPVAAPVAENQHVPPSEPMSLSMTARPATMPTLAAGQLHGVPLVALQPRIVPATQTVMGTSESVVAPVRQQSTHVSPTKAIEEVVDPKLLSKVQEMILDQSNRFEDRFAHLEAERLELAQQSQALQAQLMSLTHELRVSGGQPPDRQVSSTVDAQVAALSLQLSELRDEFTLIVSRPTPPGGVEMLRELEDRLAQHLDVARSDQQAETHRLREDMERVFATSHSTGAEGIADLEQKVAELVETLRAELVQAVEAEQQERLHQVEDLKASVFEEGRHRVELADDVHRHRIEIANTVSSRLESIEVAVEEVKQGAIDRLREELRERQPIRKELDSFITSLVHPEREARIDLTRSLEAERTARINDLDNERSVRAHELSDLRSAVLRLESRLDSSISEVERKDVQSCVASTIQGLEATLLAHRQHYDRELTQMHTSLQDASAVAGDIVSFREQINTCMETVSGLAIEVRSDRTNQEKESGDIFARLQHLEQSPADVPQWVERMVQEIREQIESENQDMRTRLNKVEEKGSALGSLSDRLQALRTVTTQGRAPQIEQAENKPWQVDLQVTRRELAGDLEALRQSLLDRLGASMADESQPIDRRALSDLRVEVQELISRLGRIEARDNLSRESEPKPGFEQLKQALEVESVNRHVGITEIHARIHREIAVIHGHIESKWQELVATHGRLAGGYGHLAGTALSCPPAHQAEELAKAVDKALEVECERRIQEEAALRAEFRRALEQERTDRMARTSELRSEILKSVQR
mmetsp:Transcript_12534/g.31316  ORF Transcript_12534/g.31316 Transcript_12534/m.31316 type:complete len:827 (+) Transcript_12534:20-2500(+)